MKAFILSAGLGTRLLPYSRKRPKPLFTLNRRPVLGLTIERLQEAGFNTIIVNTHHCHEEITAFLAAQTYSAKIIVRHEPELLGTGGAVRNIADLWLTEGYSDPLLIINGDIVTDIDPAQVYAFHGGHAYPVTMVMHDYAPFNSVAVSPDNFIDGFRGKEGGASAERQMAFTGIHVVDPRVLDYIPPKGAVHIIDVYAAMLAKGEKIKIWQPSRHYWQDIGTPQSYREAAANYMASLAFESASATVPVDPPLAEALQGDGSDRKWFRFSTGADSLVMVDHGIRSADAPIDEVCEVDAFVAIGRHLDSRGAAVPKIYLHDEFSGLVFLEDLGNTHLCDAALGRTPAVLKEIYCQVIDRWIHMAMEGYQGFNPGWTYQTPRYDRQVILEKECRYFVEAFGRDYLGLSVDYQALAEEFETLAGMTLANGLTGFMHRDLQSRNIMIKNKKPYFIDFQAGRLGPLQYDLAALLIDPYVALPQDLQDDLLSYADQALANRYKTVGPQALSKGFDYCALCRNLQILGAFAFLSRAKHKRQFEAYIPQAVQTLVWRLAYRIHEPLPKLRQILAAIVEAISSKDTS